MFSRSLIFTSLLSLTLPLAAQQEIFRFPSGHDMARGRVQAMAVDHGGYLWVGGQSSLRQYDGTTVEYFGNRREDTTDLSGDYVEDLLVDHRGTLWIGQQNGLSRFDYRDERFYNYAIETGASRVEALCEFPRGQLWVVTPDSLHRFSVEENDFFSDPGLSSWLRSVDQLDIRALLPLTDKRLGLITARGLFAWNLVSQKGDQLKLPDSIGLDYQEMVAMDSSEFILGTEAGYAWLRWREAGFEVLGFIRHGKEVPQNIISGLSVGERKSWWGTQSGLVHLDWSDEKAPRIFLYHHEDNEEDGLSSAVIPSLAVSLDGVLLIGTENGIDRIDLNSPPFPVLRRGVNGTDICHNVTKGTAFDAASGLLVVGTQAGLSLVDPATRISSCYTPESLPGLRTGYIFNVDPGPFPSTYWLCYRNEGTNLLDLSRPDQPTIREIEFGDNDPRGGGVYQAAVDQDGIHWLATSKGLLSYDPKSGLSNRFDTENTEGLSTNNILCLTNDSQNRLWLGTLRGGLCVRQIIDGTPQIDCFTYAEDDPKTIPSNIVLNVFEDVKGRIWISTPEALVLYLEDGNFHTFGLADGLEYTFNYGAFADQEDRLWTLFGGNLCRFSYDPEEGFQLQTETTRREGLSSMPNTQYGWTVLPDGKFAISGRNGLSLIDPDSLETAVSFPSLILTDFFLFNQPVGTKDRKTDPLAPDFTLPDDVNTLSRIILPPDMNYLGFAFSAPVYRRYHEPHYAWKMDGIQDTWVDLGTEHQLSFPRLPPGDYTLEIRQGDGNGRWAPDHRTIDLLLLAPWYERAWARLIFLGLGVLVILGVLKARDRQRLRLETIRRTEREELRRRSARDFHDEAGNYLTRASLLVSVAERAVSKEKEKLPGLLREINGDIQQLREGMRDFIWAIDPDLDNAYELCLKLKRFGQDLFDHHPARFLSSPVSEELKSITLRSDQRRHLLLIGKEAMHNSLKYAMSATEVRLTLKAENGGLELKWEDNGPGYAKGVTEGMGSKSIRQRVDKLGGTLRMDGTSGSRISVTIPLDRMKKSPK